MNEHEIRSLQKTISPAPELIETHISWVLVHENYCYKIKKPIRLSFLDYSTLSKRKYYCEKELELNSRLCPDIYLDVCPICLEDGNLKIYQNQKITTNSHVVDYALRMKTIDRALQMDEMLKNRQVTEVEVSDLGWIIGEFHSKSPIISDWNLSGLVGDFNDIVNYVDLFDSDDQGKIKELVNQSDRFINHNKTLFKFRSDFGFVRDVHGDLHPGNIFLTQPPIIFDCIEFNDHLRQIDVFAEIAFFLMEMDHFQHEDLEDCFLEAYQHSFPLILQDFNLSILNYYKMYRANVRSKVLAIQYSKMHDIEDKFASSQYLDQAFSYLDHIYS